MHNTDLVPYRQHALFAAEGRVLEIGIGRGVNLPFYGPIRVGEKVAPRLRLILRQAHSITENLPNRAATRRQRSRGLKAALHLQRREHRRGEEPGAEVPSDLISVL